MGTHPIFESDFDCLTGIMFRDRGEEEIIYVRPDNESVEAKRERIEKYIPIDIGKVLDIAEQGPTLKNGEHNFDCSCMGSLPYGPCGQLYRNVMNCMLHNQYLGDQAQMELCGFSRMMWTSCMDEHWKNYYPIAANVESRQK